MHKDLEDVSQSQGMQPGSVPSSHLCCPLAKLLAMQGKCMNCWPHYSTDLEPPWSRNIHTDELKQEKTNQERDVQVKTKRREEPPENGIKSWKQLKSTCSRSNHHLKLRGWPLMCHLLQTKQWVPCYSSCAFRLNLSSLNLVLQEVSPAHWLMLIYPPQGRLWCKRAISHPHPLFWRLNRYVSCYICMFVN